MNDYERIARLIRALAESPAAQPDWTRLAARLGLSPFDFHRLFTTWAGITPQDFVQCLTRAHARALLRRGESSLAAGLSGAGRWHDAGVSLEAASPGEVPAGARNGPITAGFADSPFGTCLVGAGPRGICALSFVEPGKAAAALAALQDAWPTARLRRDDTAAARFAGTVFQPAASRPPLRAFVRGTAFQVRVWRALLEIRPGTLLSYGRLAALIGQPSAARAVGAAVGQNPLAYLIPCHRVILESGAIGNYRWGRERKQAMLAWESSPQNTARPSASSAGGPSSN